MGSGGKSVGYLAHGTATDYMYDTAGVPLSFTWEIYGDMKADYVDCFKQFNPIDQAAVEQVISNWAGAVLSLIELLPQHPDIAALNLAAVSKVPATASNPHDSALRLKPQSQIHSQQLQSNICHCMMALCMAEGMTQFYSSQEISKMQLQSILTLMGLSMRTC